MKGFLSSPTHHKGGTRMQVVTALAALAAGFLCAVAGLLCMVPGALFFYAIRFWQLMCQHKFTNQNRLYIVRLATAITTVAPISRGLFWLLRGIRGIYIFFKCIIFSIPMLLVGMAIGCLYGAMKVAQLTARESDEFDTV
jgi:hypothetical protein